MLSRKKKFNSKWIQAVSNDGLKTRAWEICPRRMPILWIMIEKKNTEIKQTVLNEIDLKQFYRLSSVDWKLLNL